MFEYIKNTVNQINNIVWGAPTIILLIGCGIFFSFLLKFFQFTKIRLWLDNTLFAIFKKGDVRKKESGKNISQFQAVSTALAATIGTGNITGVATAISAGGPGAVFWMWVSACFGMMTSYAENVLGIYYRKKNSDGEWYGGPMYYIKNGLSEKKHIKKIAKPLSAVYAVFLAGASFGIGNMTQANSISSTMHTSFGISVYIVAAILAIITFIVVSGGVKRIGSVTEKLVPFMALFYISAALFIFISNYNSVPYVFSSIFHNAFSFKAVFGAAGGIAIKKCISMGFRRGVFSNEAGLGASVTVSSCSNVKEPSKQGMWGIFQVFVDTFIVCTMTAFVLLSTSVSAVPLSQALENISRETQYVCIGNEADLKNGKIMLTDQNANNTLAINNNGNTYTVTSESGKYSYTNIMALTGICGKDGNITDIKFESIDGSSLMILAFSERFGKLASVMLSAAIVLFAFSTIIAWSFYGLKATEYLFGNKSSKIYKVIFVAVAFIGSVTELSVVWGISDILNALMAVPNIIALLFLSGTVKKITKNFLARANGEKIEPMLSADAEIQFETQYDCQI